MIQVSLDSEPPPNFRGKKEVKKKSKNLPQLVFSLKNKNNSNSLKDLHNKKLEDKIKNSSSNVSSTEDYSALERYSSEENTDFSQKNTKFSNLNHGKGDSDKIILDYPKVHESNLTENSENLNFYFKSSEYNFIFSQTFIKDNNKEKKDYSESIEKQEKEQTYTLFSFDDEKTTEENTIKWNVTAYN